MLTLQVSIHAYCLLPLQSSIHCIEERVHQIGQCVLVIDYGESSQHHGEYTQHHDNAFTIIKKAFTIMETSIHHQGQHTLHDGEMLRDFYFG